LAIAVVVYHSYKIFGLRMCGGQVAVESFYMISGFYMAMILNEKYTGSGNYKRFILSRAFRIFPVYWLILILAAIFSLVGYFGWGQSYYLFRYINHHACLSPLTICYFILENVMVLGQDILYFMRLDEGCRPVLTYNVLSYKHTGYQYLLVPQAWTISIEFMFYLIAPFLVRKEITWQVLLALAGFGAKYYFSTKHYLSFDPWTYRFFPFELAFFLSGSICYRVYLWLRDKNIPDVFGNMLLVLTITTILFYDEIICEAATKNFFFYLFVFAAIPFIFKALKNNKADRFIGELSFSIYISHHIVVSLFRTYFFENTHLIAFYGYAVVSVSILFAIGLYWILIRNVEKYRRKSFS
jgi:peptidoglycan/LPS O-acetylase OafA/YrhL